LVGVQLVGSLEDGSSSELGIVLHEELLSSLVAGWSSAFLSVVGVDRVHNLILVSSVEARDFLISPGVSSGDVSSEFLRFILRGVLIIANFDGAN